jgi:hypothetical protein
MRALKPALVGGWVTAFLLVAVPPVLEACTCFANDPPQVEREQADGVFLGVVVSAREPDVRQGSPAIGPAAAFQFRVSQAWKGVSTRAIEVGTSIIGTACGYDFRDRRGVPRVRRWRPDRLG